MKKQQIHIYELTNYQPDPDILQAETYIKTFQTAILLSLLEKGQLSKRQFDLCSEELQGKDIQPYV